MISTPIPTSWSAYGDYFYGQNRLAGRALVAGGSGEHYGVMFETVQIESDGFKTIDDNDRNTTAGYDFEDWMLKGRSTPTPARSIYQALEFKYGRSKQDAQQSYLGLTDADFKDDPNRLYAATQIDQLDTDHTLRQVAWRIEPARSPGSSVSRATTTASSAAGIASTTSPASASAPSWRTRRPTPTSSLAQGRDQPRRRAARARQRPHLRLEGLAGPRRVRPSTSAPPTAFVTDRRLPLPRGLRGPPPERRPLPHAGRQHGAHHRRALAGRTTASARPT
jgi:hypothetical protein